eukprot:gnl/TRDRNA2_/TRDRNA2_100105_c2_seq1.p1 gnl/TRDRNA2_/TRDRNA2_100105_c2~~gnl/TRDRNA2_/TRDRNA2_100105_c2_seq1.p1  ORF type:complete len:138 (+),score=8.34 gnl/TRDRNA2_/TRDRNA2_100105_c2_seq1:48-416(+)
MVAVMLGCYPLNFLPMLAPIRATQRGAHARGGLVTLSTLGIIGSSMMVAFFVTNLGIMNVVNGAVVIGGYVAIVPGLVGFYILKRNWVVMSTLIVLGTVLAVIGFIFTDNYVQQLAAHCLLR